MSSKVGFVDNLSPFESALHRVSSAQANIAELERRLEPFRKVNQEDIVQRTDPETGEDVLYVRFRRVPIDERRLATNISGELRSALDDAMGDAAMQLGRANAKGVYFPVCEDSAGFEGEVKRKCRGVDPSLLNFIRALEPYKHGKDEMIWILSKLAGAAKHRPYFPLIQFVDTIMIQTGSSLRPLGPFDQPNSDNEIAVAAGTAQTDKKIGVRAKIIVNAKMAGLALQGNAEISDLASIVERVILGIKAETERILRSRS